MPPSAVCKHENSELMLRRYSALSAADRSASLAGLKLSFTASQRDSVEAATAFMGIDGQGQAADQNKEDVWKVGLQFRAEGFEVGVRSGVRGVDCGLTSSHVQRKEP